jgi:hypothetical protein
VIGNPMNVLGVRPQEHLFTSRRMHHKERVSKIEDGDEIPVLEFDFFFFFFLLFLFFILFLETT